MTSLASLIQTLPVYTDALGPQARTTVFDLATSPPCVVATSGQLTGVSADTVLARLDELISSGAEAVPPRISADTRGRSIRSSWALVTEGDKTVGAVYIEVDVTVWTEASAHVAWYHAASAPVERGQSSSDMEEVRAELVRAALDRIGVPVSLLLKNHKLAITRELDDNGFFLLREAVPYLAAALSVSRHSIYNYLNDIRDTDAHSR